MACNRYAAATWQRVKEMYAGFAHGLTKMHVASLILVGCAVPQMNAGSNFCAFQGFRTGSLRTEHADFRTFFSSAAAPSHAAKPFILWRLSQARVR